MTNEEAIEHIRELYDWYIEEEPLSEHFLKHDAMNMAIETLEKADKYRWHDLRKNPNDLPRDDEEVLVRTIGGVSRFLTQQRVAWRYAGYWAYSGGNLGGTVIAWRKLEPFEEDNSQSLE